MRSPYLKICLIAFTAGLVTGCQTIPYQGKAREVKKRSGQGGVIALPIDPRPEDRNLAETKMRGTCGELASRILEEGEVAVGTKTVQDDRSTHRDDTRQDAGTFLGMKVQTGEAGGVDTRTQSTTETVKEWQISYECVTTKKATR